MPLEPLDAVRGGVKEMVGQIGQGTSRGELLADGPDARVQRSALGLTVAVVPRAGELEDRVRAGTVALLGEAMLTCQRCSGMGTSLSLGRRCSSS
jgi:hypothetical protein